MSLFRRVSRRIEACNGIAHVRETQQKSERQTLRSERNHSTTGVTGKVLEGEQAGEIEGNRRKSKQGNDQHHSQAKDQVTAEVRQLCRQFNPIVIEESLCSQDNSYKEELVPVPKC